MTSSSEARRPSVRLALAEAISMRVAEQPISPYSVVKREASMPARAAKHEEAMTPAANDGGNGFFVAPVAVAIDRTGGHAAMREDILLPLDGKQRRELTCLSCSQRVGSQGLKGRCRFFGSIHGRRFCLTSSFSTPPPNEGDIFSPNPQMRVIFLHPTPKLR